jgi:hypothetical protein
MVGNELASAGRCWQSRKGKRKWYHMKMKQKWCHE